MSNIKPLSPNQTIYVQLDLERGWVNQRSIVFKQKDNNTRKIRVKLTNKLPINFTGYTPYVFVETPQETIYSFASPEREETKGEIEFVTNSTLLSEIGTHKVEIVLVKDNVKVLSFPTFPYSVEGSIHGEESVEPGEEVGLLWDTLRQAEEKLTEVENRYSSFEQDKEDSFASLQDKWENEFNLNEVERQQAETERVEAFSAMEEKVDKVYNSTITLLYDVVE